MTTLGGDLIRLLAHTGLNTVGGIGTALINNWLQPGMVAKENYAKGLLDVLGNPQNIESAKAAQEQLRKFGVDVPDVTVTNPAGTEATSAAGARLTVPRSTPLGELASGISPTVGPLRLVPSLDKLKASIISGLPPGEQKTAVAPTDTTLQAKAMELAANRIFTEAEKEKDRAARKETSQDRLDTLKTIAEGNRGTKEAMLGIARINAQTRQDMMKAITGKFDNQAEKDAAALLEKSHEQYLNMTGPLGNEKARVAAAEQFNSNRDRLAKKYPNVGALYNPIPVEEYQSSTYWGLGTPETKKRIGSGAGAAAKAPAAKASTAAPAITLDAIQAEKRRRGLP